MPLPEGHVHPVPAKMSQLHIAECKLYLILSGPEWPIGNDVVDGFKSIVLCPGQELFQVKGAGCKYSPPSVTLGRPLILQSQRDHFHLKRPAGAEPVQ